MGTVPQVVSLSGGKDSLAMALLMLERGERIDAVVWADLGWDFPETVAMIDRFEEVTGIEVVRIRLKHTILGWLSERIVLDKDTKELKYVGYGWPSWSRRWCTREKVTYIDKFVLGTFGKAVQCIGFAKDEKHRCEGKAQKKKRDKGTARYPLIEYGITERQALQLCLERGFTWGGLYELFDRVSCFCCPLQGVGKLRIIYRKKPEIWQRIKALDVLIPLPKRRFEHEATVDDLERRFAKELENGSV